MAARVYIMKQKASLLRVHKRERFAVMLHSTRAVVAVLWKCPDPLALAKLCSASYAKPVEVSVDLGEYDLSKAAFEGSLAMLMTTGQVRGSCTRYKRVSLSSLR